MHLMLTMHTGMKASPRYREAIAFIRLRHQPPTIKYPLVGLHFVSNPNVYIADQLNVKNEVRRPLPNTYTYA